jgi:predicted lipoprotein with Yx(FWY)xxD motif
MVVRPRRLLLVMSLVGTLAFALVLAAATHASGGTVVKSVYNKHLKAAILVDGGGRTLYLLTSDPKGVSTCAGLAPDCPTTWPALRAPAKAGAGAKPGLLAATKDGKQVTYNGHPLYRYAGDKKPGDLNGQGSFQIWYAVSPKGTAIKKQ